MINDDVVKCPLCGGFTHVDKPGLLQVLQDPKIHKQVDDYASQLLASASGELAAVGAADARDFNKNVHKWNSNVAVGRRSPKE
jgi:hypothetical protein